MSGSQKSFGRTFIIAEAGVNHNGNTQKAFEMVEAAVSCGVNAIKFQTFRTENLVTRTADKASYQKQITGTDTSQFEMLKQLELSYTDQKELALFCRYKGIRFLSTAFDFESLDFLVDKLHLNLLKIPSGEITNGPFLMKYAQTGANLILSTGMATINEIREALAVIAFGLTNAGKTIDMVSKQDFLNAFESVDGQALLKQKLTLLHCTTDYPVQFDDINLSAIRILKKTFGVPVGYSDHSAGIFIPPLAVALGAQVIEKHFTLDKTMEGPDHKASITPEELKMLVYQVRQTELILGNGLKEPTIAELSNIKVIRKSLVASKRIRAGERFSEKNIEMKRPGTGRSPMEYWSVIGQKSNKEYHKDEIIN